MKKLSIPIVLLSLMLFFACDVQNIEPVDLSQEGPLLSESKAFDLETPIQLAGITRFTAYSIKGHRWIKHADEGGPDVMATLTHVSGHNYLLETTETVPIVFREMLIDVKITPGGQVMFSWPDEWMQLSFAVNPPALVLHSNIVEQVKSDMGYVIHGPGVNKVTLDYKGTFDGERFFANVILIGEQVQPGTFAPWFTEVVDGPIKVEFLIDLTVNTD